MSADKWFDHVAKSVARSRSRRELLTGISAVFAGAVFAAFSSSGRAQGKDCVDYCKGQGYTGRDLGDCIADCESSRRVVCGPVLCPEGYVCCNESCGICVVPGGFCTPQPCEPI